MPLFSPMSLLLQVSPSVVGSLWAVAASSGCGSTGPSKLPRSLQLVTRSLRLLDRRSRRLYVVVVTAQVLVSGLDLVAVALMALVVAGASSVAFGTTQTSNQGLLASLVPESAGGVLLFAGLAGALLIIKSLTSLFLTRRTYRFSANRSAAVSSATVGRVLALPLVDIQRRASQQLTQALTLGVNAATVNTLGPFSVILAEISLVTLLLFALLTVDPSVAIFTVVFFGVVAVLLQLFLGRWAQRLGKAQAESDVGSMTALQHALRAYRELVVSHRRELFVRRFEVQRWKSASVLSDTFILSQAGKYVFEVALVLGAAALVVLLAFTRSIEGAVVALAVFLLVASRTFPSLLRLQNAFSQLRNSEGISSDLFEVLRDLDALEVPQAPPTVELGASCEFEPTLLLSRVSVVYPGASTNALVDVSLAISAGQSVAIVGPSGAGKSTLVDVMLGVTRPSAGSVSLSGVPPQQAVTRWPGSVAYVPQDVAILSGTVRDNVALGVPTVEIQDDLVWEALRRAHLSDLLKAFRNGLDTEVGEHGVKLSGGQSQRLGIARALYTFPKLLVLDEATSALDAQTEREISDTLADLGGQITTIVVAHRLATVRNSSLVIYLEQGHVLARGTFDEIRQAIPSFDQQAGLLGL